MGDPTPSPKREITVAFDEENFRSVLIGCIEGDVDFEELELEIEDDVIDTIVHELMNEHANSIQNALISLGNDIIHDIATSRARKLIEKEGVYKTPKATS